MKKFISILVAAVMAASCLSACGQVNSAALETEQSYFLYKKEVI